MFATLSAFGDVFIEVEDGEIFPRGPTKAWRMLSVGAKKSAGGIEIGLTRHRGYALGLLSDPILLHPAAFLCTSVASRDAAQSCDSAWSGIVVPPAGALRHLEGRAPR